MSKKHDLPGLAHKRDILFSKRSSQEKMRQTGQQFLEAGRYYDALEFIQRAGAADLARQIVRTAIDAGDTALLMRAKKVLAEGTSEQEWSSVAANAEKAGLYSAAWLAHSKAGHVEEAARVRQLMPGAPKVEPEQTAEGQ